LAAYDYNLISFVWWWGVTQYYLAKYLASFSNYYL